MADHDSFDAFRRIIDAAALARGGRGREALTLLPGDESGDIALDIAALLLRASICEQLVEGGDASRAYDEALRRFPRDGAVLLRAGVWSYRTGDLVKAEMLLRRSWNEGRSPEAGYFLGLLDTFAGRRQPALEKFSYVISSEEPDGTWRAAAETAAATLSSSAHWRTGTSRLDS